MSKITIGSAPDSWGIWYAEDPHQTPVSRFLDEVAEAGYEWIEIGAYGYLPTDAERLRTEMASRNLRCRAARRSRGCSIPEPWSRLGAGVARSRS